MQKERLDKLIFPRAIDSDELERIGIANEFGFDLTPKPIEYYLKKYKPLMDKFEA